MAILPFKGKRLVPGYTAGALRFWQSVRALSTQDIVQEAERPFVLTLIGPTSACRALAMRLAQEAPATSEAQAKPIDIEPYLQTRETAQDISPGSLTLAAEGLADDESALAQALAHLVLEHGDLRLSLARHVPAFRPAVTSQMIAEASWDNAKLAVVSALPGILPFTDILLPATAIGDMILLTKNQARLLLYIAAAHGLPPDVRARTRELLPVVGSAFGWRAVARELIGLVPGGIGVVVKGSVAYAGTYTVGKAAAIYYSTGQTLSGPRLKKLYRDALQDATVRVRGLIRRPRAEKGVLKTARNKMMSIVDKHTQHQV